MNKTLVFQSDFGLVDGAVAAMYGVALSVDESLRLYDLTHEVRPYDTWEASYRLYQTIEYWPVGTVFVSVVDPGVGSDRRSVAVRTKRGHYIVTPDNGSLTHIKLYAGIDEIRQIDESEYMLAGGRTSYTFHGRDLYANAGAKLASGQIQFEAIGPLLPLDSVMLLPIGAVETTGSSVRGSIDTLDMRFGSLWTNISVEEFAALGIEYGQFVEVIIRHEHYLAYSNRIRYARSFADVCVSEQLLYVNSLMRMALAINQGNFAKAYSIGTGRQWTIELKKAD